MLKKNKKKTEFWVLSKISFSYPEIDGTFPHEY